MKRVARSALLGALAGTLLALSVGASADVYRWVDKDGRVHYSDQPPPPGARQEKELQGAPRAPGAPPAEAKAESDAPPTLQEREAEFRRRQVEQTEKAAQEQRAQEEAATRQRNCEQARNQLAALRSGQRVARFNEQGEREYLGDEQIAQEVIRAEKAVSDWCN
ncbi:MAG: DUF4124 domain-containing protein [Burkholderiales bacterium]